MDHMYLPAEWEPQSIIQLTWPHALTDWAYCLDEITSTFVALADVITRYEGLLIVTPDEGSTRQTLARTLTPVQMTRVMICQCDTNDTWARDHGALTLLHRDGTTSCDGGEQPDCGAVSPLLLDFRFNGWGEKFPAAFDNAINRHLKASGIFDVLMEDHDDFVLEGGSVESDGKGTVFTTSQCLMAPHRNQPLSMEEIEEQLKSRLRADRIVWLHHGNLVGDDTDGHIDTIVRCAPGNTLLYVCCDDEDDEQYADFQNLQSELLSLRTTEGAPYHLLSLPMPEAIYEDGERLPATYANFVILNGAVIVPTYHQPELDRKALHTIRQAFPGRDIIPLDARTVIRQHGSLHCLTMQYPQSLHINTRKT